MLQSPLLQNTGSYLNGQWAWGRRALCVCDPATGEHLADIPMLQEDALDGAIGAAHVAMQTTPDLDQRRTWLGRIARALLDHEQELARIITLENGKPLSESVAEVTYAASFYSVAADRIEHLRPRELPERPRGCRWTVHHRPAGVAGLIVPWNFPLAMLAKKLSGAIAAGCATLTKPAPQTPLTCIALFHLLERMDFPDGFVNLLVADARKVGQAFCTDPRVRTVSFTGSTAVGRTLLRDAEGRIKRFALELGGNAPLVIFEDADLPHAVEELIRNKFRVSGQTCVCTNRVLVQASVHDRFLELLVPRVRQLKVGNGMEQGVDIGPLIDRDGFNKVADHVRDALEHGARRIVGDDPPRPRGRWGAFYPPTVLTGVKTPMRVCEEETFGPVIAIGSFTDEADAIERANATHYGLAAYLFTQDLAKANRVATALHFGHVGVNTATGPTAQAPFGGMLDSGLGREGGLEGLLEFTQTQVVATPL